MSGYCFYAPEAQDLVELAGIREKIEAFAEQNKKQTYVLRKPLSKDDAQYDCDEAVAIFSSGMKPCFINFGSDEESFEDYVEFFVEDIAFLSEKFRYREKIGRKRHWFPLFEQCDASDLDFENLIIETPTERRLVDLITSLVVGSINDVSKINLEASGLLDTIKSKIVLFDTDQTSFVFRSGAGKKFVIQGLAGSGKTELLLHKIKEIYSRDFDARIAFTCFNKILASSMKSRIPSFFDFMRVERQIDWSNKLFCFHSWGSGREPYSGMYRYICHYYGVPFQSLQAGSFDQVCKTAIAAIKKISGEKKFAFDYVFVDESQDFASSFIELCELVTAKKVYVAGDVFQNIFRPIDEGVNRADMVLKKCYRTDPKNLMFSHALGMGLFENPVLRWLQPHEWDACGYIYEEKNNRAQVSRDPLRRFEDIPADFKSTTVHQLVDGLSVANNLVEVVKNIRRRHPTVEQGDIAIILLDKDNYIYDVIAQLKPLIEEELGWGVNVSFETKRSDPDKLFVSNINNAKGLEFPFVICFALNLHRHPSFRNALYTMMARSFLESHLVLGKNVDKGLLSHVNSGLDFLSINSYMDLRIPSPMEIQQREFIVLDELPSLEKIVRDFCKEKEANPSPRLIAKLIDRVGSIVGDADYDEEYLEMILNAEYQRNKMI
ncbi:DEAD/DEAH box helicase [Pseudomonas sp. PHC1]|uniref:DEAD/DEAH box helicase n=1 Tax=Pseudomonas sp. PHC1 TaxID=3384759 RepID=UPI00396F502D